MPFPLSKLIVIKFIVLSLICHSHRAEVAKILFYIGGISSHSHQVGLEPLSNKLADRGHNVTFFTPLKPVSAHPQVRYFCPSELSVFHKGFSVEYGVVGLQTRIAEKYSIRLVEGSNLLNTCFIQNQVVASSPEFKRWTEERSFDLIIIDSSCNELAFGLAHKYGAKTILYTPLGTVYMWDYDLFGIPPESSWFPTWDNNYEGEMGLKSRIFNAYSSISWYLSYTRDYLTRMDKLIQDEALTVKEDKKEGSGMPPLLEIIRKADLILSSQHYSDQFAKSLPPFVVPVGGMHLVESSGKLDTELENFIEQGEGDAGKGFEGFVYISFGSIISISNIPLNLLEIFFESLGSFKNLRFLWKWEGGVPKYVPKNVLLKPWFPQKDVLAHPRIRGFITQGGQVSIQEAVFSGVPLIVFPVNGDQDMNAKRIRAAGNGIELEFFDLTTTDLKSAITRLLVDEKYSSKAKHLSKLSRDRPMSALNTAVWWTEYILRHDDNSFLKPAGFNQPWWQTRLLDVWITIFFSFLAAAILCIYFILMIYKCILSRFLTKSVKTKKEKNS